MANDVYFKNVPPQKDGQQKKRTAAPSGTAAAGSQRPRQQTAAGGGRRPAKTSAPACAQKKRKRHPFRKILLFLLILSLIAGAVLAAAGFSVYTKVLSGYEPVPMQKGGYLDEAALMHSDDVFNILLMGVDQAGIDESARSDSMILLSVDKKHRQLKLTTFMRDMYVYVPGHGNTKLTHACMYAGPQLTVDTIELNFNLRIDAYAKIGYDIFIELVDGVGGITVAEIDETEARALAEEHVYVEPGHDIYLTGEEAIKYVRIRHWQSDFDRTERQREAISLIIDRAKHTSPLKLIALAESIASKIECTIPKQELLRLFFSVLPCLTKGAAQQQIPADGTWWDATHDGLMVLELDFDRNRSILKSFLYGG